MLDQLLGRAELKARIEELEAERADLRAQLDAEAERRTDAVRDRQEAEERVNRLEDRIAELEDRVERSEETRTSPPTLRNEEALPPADARLILDRLAGYTAPPDGALTRTVEQGDELAEDLTGALGDRSTALLGKVPFVLCLDDRGLVVVALRPPLFPTPIDEWGPTFTLDPEWFLPEAQGRHALALVRSDRFAMGVYEGAERVELRGFESDVQGSHSKGGYSQRRFERRRDQQIDEHLDAARAVLADAPTPLYVVGESTVITEYEDVATVTRPSDATGEPEPALAAAVEDFWTTRLWVP